MESSGSLLRKLREAALKLWRECRVLAAGHSLTSLMSTVKRFFPKAFMHIYIYIYTSVCVCVCVCVCVWVGGCVFAFGATQGLSNPIAGSSGLQLEMKAHLSGKRDDHSGDQSCSLEKNIH